MSRNSFNLDAYLERIHYHGPVDRSFETLRQVHRQQALNIPFENLAIHLGDSIQIDPDSIVAKLVDSRRGGYCYELNGLFELFLSSLGFSFTTLAARNAMSGPPYVQKSHKLLLVEADGQRWLVDLGFSGIGLLEPVPLQLDTEFHQCIDTFRLQAAENALYHFQRLVPEGWQSLYMFTLEEYYPADYRMMNYFNSTSPASAFVQRRTCGIPTPEARITLVNFELKIRTASGTIVKQIEDDNAYRATLEQYFGIVLAEGAGFRPLPSQ